MISSLSLLVTYIGLGFRGNIGIMEKKMETTIVYWGYMGVIYIYIEWFMGLGFKV